MSSEQSREEQLLRKKVEQSEGELRDLESALHAIDHEVESLTKRNRQYALVEQVCRSLEELQGLGVEHLFWSDQDAAGRSDGHIRHARRQIEKFGEEVAEVEKRRQSVVDKINDQNTTLDYLHCDLRDTIEAEEERRNEWLIERPADEAPDRRQIMPWARGLEEDRRFQKSLRLSMAACFALALLVGTIALPVVERPTVEELPERMVKLVRKERTPPPPPAPVEEEPIPEEEPPEPEPKLVEELPPEPLPEAPEQRLVAEAAPQNTEEQVRSKGILAFRDSFANKANTRPSARLGSQARISTAGENSTGRPERLMVATSAPGSSGGINLSDISRDVGGGGGGMDGVELARVASAIGSGSGPNRPLSGGAPAGRTDEEIQIVFDRYKASLYRLYNRELRKDPTLRGQMVLKLTIEPDGSVSLCQLHRSDMDAPTLTQQIVERVSLFDFGAKEDIVAVTIIYPIDFLPAA